MPSQQIIEYGIDKRLVLANGEAIREPIFGSDWSYLRLGIHGTFSGFAGNVTGTPRLVLGVCNGTAGYGTGVRRNVVGLRLDSGTVTYNAGPPAYVHPASINTTRAVVFTGGTGFQSGAFIGNPYFSADTSVRSCLFLDITKISTSTFRFRVCWPDSTSVQTDVSDALFEEAMLQGTLAGASTVLSEAGIVYITPESSQELTVIDEATNGALDHIFVYWDRTDQQYGLNIGHRKVS